ncbi:tRNA-uridine aminocarboxypropyltransferase 2 isoform X1 [Cebus imitator]|uniref:tRNA-uridine aminocarboxypropyltransferase 2 isoform X1 n=1 Tax=Cebus imitator TaxID=2715852 RepID=UPI00189A4E59|nr:tRNA-uridine aminocarboxypropyltransferase 2 isoform X1 [Cebus imitator]
MESQKEARTLQEPVERPPGASRSQTPKDKERQEGSAVPAAAALGAEGDDTSADGLWELPVEPAERRPECSRCSRPQKVCLCPFLPAHPLPISTHLYIIQHPAEENKVLRTVPLLAACLPQDKCKVKIGRRFSEERDPELSTVCRKSGTLILYPGAEAANLEEFILDSPVYPSTIIIIDGTWSQAKDIFYKNSLFRHPKQQEDFHLQARKRALTRTLTMQSPELLQKNYSEFFVQLKTSISSQYVIRMQPTNRCLSTLECAAVALSILEKNNYIQETLLRPLQALCSFQLQHGAQIRLSKEHLLKNGLYPKPMPKNKRKLRKMELLMNSVKI